MLDKLFKFFKNTELKEPGQIPPKTPPLPVDEEKPPAPKKPRKPRAKKEAPTLSAKELATQAGEPYIAIVRVDVDPANINSGSFELDWNAKFAANLARAGYMQKPGETEDVIVDRWFQTVCRNIALEIYEQNAADPDYREADALREELRHIRTRDIGNGRTEVS
jgi:hypothetical protein